MKKIGYLFLAGLLATSIASTRESYTSIAELPLTTFQNNTAYDLALYIPSEGAIDLPYGETSIPHPTSSFSNPCAINLGQKSFNLFDITIESGNYIINHIQSLERIEEEDSGFGLPEEITKTYMIMNITGPSGNNIDIERLV